MLSAKEFILLSLAAESLETPELQSAAIHLLKNESGLTFCECCGKVVEDESMPDNTGDGYVKAGDAWSSIFGIEEDTFEEQEEEINPQDENTFKSDVADLDTILQKRGYYLSALRTTLVKQYLEIHYPELILGNNSFGEKLYVDNDYMSNVLEDYLDTPF